MNSNIGSKVTQSVDDIKKALKKQATLLTVDTDGNSQSNKSWFGKVSLFSKDESVPLDKDSNPMRSVLQLYIPSMPYIPASLNETVLLTVFVSKDYIDWVVREYQDTEHLYTKNFNNDSFFEVSPIKFELIDEDYPIDSDMLDCEDDIIALENSGKISDYFDVFEHIGGHKVGGYPTFLQYPIYFGEDDEIIFQLEVGDSNFFFAKNLKTNQWSIDFQST